MRENRIYKLGTLSDEAAELTEIVVRARNNLYRYDFANATCRFRACVNRRLYGSYVAREKRADQTAADFFPTGHLDVGGLESCIARFDESDEALRFDHS